MKSKFLKTLVLLKSLALTSTAFAALSLQEMSGGSVTNFDAETQTQFSVKIVATDGGGKILTEAKVHPSRDAFTLSNSTCGDALASGECTLTFDVDKSKLAKDRFDYRVYVVTESPNKEVLSTDLKLAQQGSDSGYEISVDGVVLENYSVVSPIINKVDLALHSGDVNTTARKKITIKNKHLDKSSPEILPFATTMLSGREGYSIERDNCAGRSLVPGGFCSFEIVFNRDQKLFAGQYLDMVGLGYNIPVAEATADFKVIQFHLSSILSGVKSGNKVSLEARLEKVDAEQSCLDSAEDKAECYIKAGDTASGKAFSKGVRCLDGQCKASMELRPAGSVVSFPITITFDEKSIDVEDATVYTLDVQDTKSNLAVIDHTTLFVGQDAKRTLVVSNNSAKAIKLPLKVEITQAPALTKVTDHSIVGGTCLSEEKIEAAGSCTLEVRSKALFPYDGGSGVLPQGSISITAPLYKDGAGEEPMVAVALSISKIVGTPKTIEIASGSKDGLVAVRGDKLLNELVYTIKDKDGNIITGLTEFKINDKEVSLTEVAPGQYKINLGAKAVDGTSRTVVIELPHHGIKEVVNVTMIEEHKTLFCDDDPSNDATEKCATFCSESDTVETCGGFFQ